MFHALLAIIYLSFISLGLPDSLLGAAWPVMYPSLDVPMSYAGILSTIIAAGTVVSSLQSDRMTRWLGTGKVTALSVALSAAGLLGFSLSHSYAALCLWAIPYGLGAGSVDASINNYAAIHCSSRHMSWLHCMWGVGASIGPYIMSFALTGGYSWQSGYRWIGVFQVMLAIILFLSLPLWKTGENADISNSDKSLSLSEIFAIPGVKEVIIAFLCSCTIESTTGLWASSYLALYRGVEPEAAAGFAGLFYLGITAGRAVSGVIAARLSDTQMVHLGQVLVTAGALAMLLPLGTVSALTGLLIIGLGCAPIYPCIVHATPERFGADRSQAIIGVQMACAYTGTCFIPPLFGLLANHISIALLPPFLLALMALMAAMYQRLCRICG